MAATLPLLGKPEFPVADGKGSVFVNIEDKSEILHFNAARHTVLATWPLAPCQSPSGLAIVDAKIGKIVATPAIGVGPDAAMFSPKDHYAFSSNGGSGTLTVLREDAPDRFSILQNLRTQKRARTMALDPDGKRVYLVTAEFGPRPAPTAENPRPRPQILPGTFVVLVAAQASPQTSQ